MSDKHKSVALLVHSCDRYDFLYNGFNYFFKKHWDFDIPCNYYFATEEKEAHIHGFKNIKSGRGEWTDRLHFLLKEKIKEDYVLYFQEDMWLSKDVNKEFSKKLFDIAIHHKWKQVKLDSSEVYKTIPTDIFIEGFNIARLDNAASDYLMSHQVTLWDKHFLLKQLQKSEHPWRNEKRGTKRLRKINPEIFHADYFAGNGKQAINNNSKPIGRSEYQSISVNGTLNYNVIPYIEELAMGNAKNQAYAHKLQYHYDHQLTHDGKQKPRKVGIFKKMKTWLQKKRA